MSPEELKREFQRKVIIDELLEIKREEQSRENMKEFYKNIYNS